MRAEALVRTAALLLAAAAAAAAAHTAAPRPDAAARQLEAKVDERVRAAMASGATVPVLVLCRSQLALGPGALERFAAANAGRPRRELRAEVVARLRAAAAAEQPAVVAALGEGARRFWIVNAVAAVAGPEAIERAARLDEVLYVYHAGSLAAAGAAGGGVAEVLDEPERPPFSARGKRVAWNLREVGAARVWRRLGVTGEGVVVALLDAGTEYTHPDLRANVWRNVGEVPNNGRDDDRNGYADDLYGYDFSRPGPEVGAGATPHGTFTAGIVAGDGTGGTVTGVAPRARLMLLRGGPLDAMLGAHEYAISNGADVMSMSFSLPRLGDLRGVWRLASDHAVAAGLVLVSGAGNFRTTEAVPEQIRIPEGIPSVLGVGGVDRRGALAEFSSTGPVEWASVRFYGDYPLPAGLVKPDLVAFPGAGYPLLRPGGGYIDPNPSIRGNSFSGPHVAGVAALVLSAAPELAAWRVAALLEATAKDLGAPGKDPLTGSGLVDAYAAVLAAREEARGRQGPARP